MAKLAEYKPQQLVLWYEKVLRENPAVQTILNKVGMDTEIWSVDKLYWYYSNGQISSLPPYLQRVLLKDVWGIKNNKKVLVEKPATVNFSEIKNIKDFHYNKDVFFAEAFMYRYHPQISKVIELLNKNVIGKLISMDSVFGIDTLTKKNFFGFKIKKKLNKESRIYNKNLGGGAILDLGCYPVSFSTLIASLISKIDYSKVRVLNKKKEIGSTGVDIDSYAELNFENNFKCNVSASFTRNLGKYSKIVGSKGELILENTWDASPSIIKILGENSQKIEIDDHGNIFSHEINKLSQCILENKKNPDFPGLTMNDTLENMKILDNWLN